jgi:hypothetical protein
MFQKSLLIATIDSEDRWVDGGFSFDVPYCNTYEEAVEYCLPILQSQEFIARLVKEDDLESFLGVNEFQFKKVEYIAGKLVFTFELEDGQIVGWDKSLNFIKRYVGD